MKRVIIDVLQEKKLENLRARNILVKTCVLSKYHFERSNNKMLKYNFFRKWKNSNVLTTINQLNVFKKNDPIKSILFIKTVEKLIKLKILKLFKYKALRLKKINESKKIDFYINLNQVKYNLIRQKHVWN